MINSIRIERNVPMEMRDGTVLVSDIYRPDDGGRYPAVMMRTPYHGDLIYTSHLNPLKTVQAGYALIVACVRGRYGSQGKYDLAAPQEIEGADCYDSVEWAAAQPWCDGNIGMSGESALGTVQWKTARENPPHLKAIAPGLAGAPGESGPETTDAPINLNIAVNLLLVLAGDTLDKMDREGMDTGEIRRALDQIRADPALAYNYLPLKGVPQFDYPGVRDIWKICLGMSATGNAPVEGFPFSLVKVPALCVSGWYDPFSRNSFNSFAQMVSRAGSDYARQHQHLLVGPWCHARPQRVLGDIDFGPLADDAGSGTSAYLIAFFDKYLKGETRDLAAVRYFTMGCNLWQEAAAWPPPEVEWQRYFLHSRSGAASSAGDGRLDRREPGPETPDSYVYDPRQPVPTAGGRGGPAENGFIYGPVEQSRVESRSDVLCYTTPPLENDLEISGPLRLHLFASTTGIDTDFTAKLVDVYPDGRAFNVADGITRGQYRNSFSLPEPLQPGEVTEFVIRLGNTSQTFRRGHRVRLDIASSNFPTFDRNLNTGHVIGEDAAGQAVRQTVFHQSGQASYIDFPVMPPA